MITNWDEQVALLSEVFTTETQYDALNRPLKITHSDNSMVNYEYDKGGFLQCVEELGVIN